MIASQASFHRETDLPINGRGAASLGKAQRRRSDFTENETAASQPQASAAKPSGTASKRSAGKKGHAMSASDALDNDDLTMLLNDKQWKQIENLPEVGRLHSVGRRPTDDREVLEAVLFVMKHQARWQDLPSDYPSPRTCQRRLRRWQDKGVWTAIWRTYLLSLDDQTLAEWGEIFLDVALAQVNPDADNAKQRIGRPPFWFAMSNDFWLITWDRHPDQVKAKFWDHADEIFGPEHNLTPPASTA